jgi:hypothetical protein
MTDRQRLFESAKVSAQRKNFDGGRTYSISQPEYGCWIGFAVGCNTVDTFAEHVRVCYVRKRRGLVLANRDVPLLSECRSTARSANPYFMSALSTAAHL